MMTNEELDQNRRHRATLKAEIARAEEALCLVNFLLVCETIKGFIADENGFDDLKGLDELHFQLKVGVAFSIPDVRSCNHSKNLLGTHVYKVHPDNGLVGRHCVFCGES